jgi:hypothetical protein
MHIDRFGNLVSDIRSSDLPPGPVEVCVGAARIDGISRTYSESRGLAALIGSSGYLEISLRNGSAAGQIDVLVGDEVSVLAVS